MKVLLINRSFFTKGGAETVYFRERGMLKQAGVQVVDFSMQHENSFPSDYTNYLVSDMDYHKVSNLLGGIRTAVNFIRNSQARKEILALSEGERPDIIRFHNIYHQLTPALIKATCNPGCKTVLAAHDYKVVCPAYSMLHDGKVCDPCIIGAAFNASRYRYQEGSASKSSLFSLETTWQYIAQNHQAPDVIVSLNVFLRGVLLRTLLSSRIDITVNGVDDSYSLAEVSDKGYMLYFGHLSHEKDMATLLAVYRKMQSEAPPKVVGHGPSHDELAAKYPDVEFLGYVQQREALDKLIRHTRVVILPSGCYENYSMAVLEAMSLSKPVIGSCIGDVPE